MNITDVATIYGKALADIYKRVASNELGSQYAAPRDVMDIIETAMRDINKGNEND